MQHNDGSKSIPIHGFDCLEFASTNCCRHDTALNAKYKMIRDVLCGEGNYGPRISGLGSGRLCEQPIRKSDDAVQVDRRQRLAAECRYEERVLRDILPVQRRNSLRNLLRCEKISL